MAQAAEYGAGAKSFHWMTAALLQRQRWAGACTSFQRIGFPEPIFTRHLQP
jgi:GH24 family phage-related lysozyme (muramidase)